jgi:CheY-like chemotaxis protein
MTPPNHISVLIVDRSDSFAPELRQRLVPLGLHVHVVHSPTLAIRLANAKKIDVAVIEYALDTWAKDLVAALNERHIPIVYTASRAARQVRDDRPQPIAVSVG